MIKKTTLPMISIADPNRSTTSPKKPVPQGSSIGTRTLKGQRIVPAVGPETAELILIGEAPGAEEIIEEQPFIGPAGKFLNRLLENAGINRETAWVTNVVKIRPPENKIFRLKELGTTVSDWIPRLISELRNLRNKKVLVTLGETALAALFPDKKVTTHRGSILWHDGLKVWVVPTYHPSFLMQYAYNLHTLAISDLMRAQRIITHGHVPTPRLELIRPSFNEAIRWLQDAQKAPAFAWDLETFGDQISCFGVAVSPSIGMCIPFKNGFNNYWTYDQELRIWEEIRKLMSGPNLKISHNGFRFDNEFIYRAFGAQPAKPHFDTLLAHSLCYPELKHSLDLLTSMYTDVPYYKDDTKSADDEVRKFDQSRMDEGYFQTLWKYNAKDAYITFECYQKLVKDLTALKLYDFYVGYEQPLRRALFDISNLGIPVDDATLTALTLESEKKIQEYTQNITTITGHPLNVKSPKQMIKFLYEDLGLPAQYKKNKQTGKSTPTVSEEAIESLITRMEQGTIQLKNPNMLQAMRQFILLRGEYKLQGNYYNRDKIDDDGRLRTSYGITETGRLSSKKKLGGKGTNLQNQPAEVRVLYRAEPGWEVFEADLAQAEARVVAYLAGCTALINEFNRPGGDVFTLIGSWIFNKPQQSVTKEERKLCKATVHGSHYGMGAFTFAQHISKPLDVAKRIQAQYFKAFPEIRLWQERTRGEVCRTRVLRTPLGRYRKFLGRAPIDETFGHDTYKKALAQVPQSSVGDIENQGLLKFHKLTLGTPVRIWCQVHDAIIGTYPVEWKERVRTMLIKAFSKEVMINGQLLRIPVEVKCGPSWGESTLWFKE